MRREPTPVSLAQVAAEASNHVRVDHYGDDVAVTDVVIDSRAVTAGSLYVAIKGSTVDGHRFIPAALERGAVAVASTDPQTGIPHLVVDDPRAALGWLAASVHRFPAKPLGLVGITGTNGKTTVAHMLKAIADGLGRKMAVVGTVSAELGEDDASPRTTPEANDLQRIFRHLVDRGEISDVAVEVSSHAMEMGRVNGTFLDVVAFTNLSQDHLDYHQTMEGYFAAKARLFTREWAPIAAIWVDDPWGARLATEVDMPVVTVGTSDSCDYSITYGTDTGAGSSFSLRFADQVVEARTALAGRFNVSNAAIALACAQLRGWDLAAAAEALSKMAPIPGRYNTVDNDRGLWIVVDYAHTPDAITNVIEETRSLVTGRVIALAGAGGDRDQEKRPLMGAALLGADVPIVTTDNPRSEDPSAILEQVVSGTHGRAIVEPDRRAAIRKALELAVDGDAVLILGKGHEIGQEFADRTVAFDDAVVAHEEMSRLGEVGR